MQEESHIIGVSCTKDDIVKFIQIDVDPPQIIATVPVPKDAAGIAINKRTKLKAKENEICTKIQSETKPKRKEDAEKTFVCFLNYYLKSRPKLLCESKDKLPE